MTQIKSLKSSYDSIIIGSGLTGLIIAQRLAERGEKVLVLEARETLGGHLRKSINKGYEFKTSLEFVPDYQEFSEPFEHLEEVLGQKVLGPSEELEPLTFNSGEFRTFVGFGDIKFPSVDEAQWYTHQKRRELLSSPESWVEQLLSEPQFDSLTLHQVTQYNFEDGLLNSLTVNGSKKIFANHFFHTAPVTALNQLISNDFLKGNEKTRLAKAQGWTSIGLYLLHDGIQSEGQNIHILSGSKTDYEPCLGRFYRPSNDKESGQVTQESHWMSWVNDEHAEDMEFVGATLKHIKKQVKRSYPKAIDTVINERIVVTPQGQGFVDLQLKSPHQLNRISNLWLASPLLVEQRGVGASVQVAESVLNHHLSLADDKNT